MSKEHKYEEYEAKSNEAQLPEKAAKIKQEIIINVMHQVS